jgi:hypothetical protein
MEITVKIMVVNQKLLMTSGHVITQAGTCCLLTAEALVIARAIHVGFVMERFF